VEIWESSGLQAIPYCYGFPNIDQ